MFSGHARNTCVSIHLEPLHCPLRKWFHGTGHTWKVSVDQTADWLVLRCFVKTTSSWHNYRRKGNLGFSFFTRRAMWCWLSNLVNWQQCHSLHCPSQCFFIPESTDSSPSAEDARRQGKKGEADISQQSYAHVCWEPLTQPMLSFPFFILPTNIVLQDPISVKCG